MIDASRAREIGARSLRNLRADLPYHLQRTAAAAVAWLLVTRVASHEEPFFAPIAAVVALNAAIGERGANAVRLVLGVFVGIVAGEIALVGFAGGPGALTVATFAAMAAASLLRGTRIVVAQAAAGAILTVATGQPEEGLHRLVDALVGVAVALVFSQLLFSPEPVRMLRAAEARALSAMAESLDLTASALGRGEPPPREPSFQQMREVRDRLSELAHTRDTSESTARHSAVWRGRRELLAGERDRAAHLELLGGSCMMLTRLSLDVSEDRELGGAVRELARAVAGVAAAPHDRAAGGRAVAGVQPIADAPAPTGGSLAREAARRVAVDLTRFVG